VLVAGKVIGKLAAQVECLFQQGLDGAKVVGGPRLGPGFVYRGAVLIELRHERRGNLGGAFIVAPRDADQAGLVESYGWPAS